MEWCLHIRGPEDVTSELRLSRFAGLEQSRKLNPIVQAAAGAIRARFGDVEFTRCAYGNEFCEHLLPGTEALAAAVQAACGRGLAFTLLTPYVSNSGLSRLRQLLPLLPSGSEVTFGDWGVLNLICREFPALKPVQGRLLNKSLRDPRVMGIYAQGRPANGAQLATLGALQRSNLDNESYRALLGRFHVSVVEMDNLPQGTDLTFARGLTVAAYVPFGFISTSRVCMAAGLHYRKREKFQPDAPCRHQCQTHLVEYSYSNSPFENHDQKFYLKGNTYFYGHTEPMMESLLAQAEAGQIGRLVFQPRIPMMMS